MNTAVAEPHEALLVLEDGRTFRGESFGAQGETFGEAVFSTGMTGYQETLTDPSYHRQVVVMTAPHVGNTGMNDEDPESQRIWVAGYVVRDPARLQSSWRSVRTLDDELREQGVVGISGVDTRALTRHLRERGAMRVGISTTEADPEALLERVRASAEMTGSDLSDEVTTRAAYTVPAVGDKRFTVAAVDLGMKSNTPRMMAERGIEVHVLPATTTLDEVLATGADGLFFSNGPGDPAATTGQVALLQGALEQGLPYFGICFGNQLFGRALGLGTYKLKYGHRGLNQPVMDRTTGKVEVTSHNHGFAVAAPLDEATQTPYGTVTVSHVCLNDDVVEGLELHDSDGRLLAFSVQYHPEAAAGPHDAAYLFDRFCELMSGSVERADDAPPGPTPSGTAGAPIHPLRSAGPSSLRSSDSTAAPTASGTAGAPIHPLRSAGPSSLRSSDSTAAPTASGTAGAPIHPLRSAGPSSLRSSGAAEAPRRPDPSTGAPAAPAADGPTAPAADGPAGSGGIN